MENSVATNLVRRPARPLSRQASQQHTSSTVAVAGTKRKNDDENSTSSPSKKTMEGGGTDGTTVASNEPPNKKILKPSPSHMIRHKPRQSNAIKPIRGTLQRDQSTHRKTGSVKKPSAISIGAARKRISSPGKRTSNAADSQAAEDEYDEEQLFMKKGLAIPDTPNQKAPSGALAIANTPDTETVTTLAVKPDDSHPYQYHGQLNPAWNIPPLKENEKPMRDFGTSFKVPKEAGAKANRAKDVGIPNAPPGRPTENGAAEANDENTEAEEEKKDERSGPLVEIIDGEIVIKQSSIIVVGGRQSTEDVDKELAADGAVVEEDAYGLTATYTSFSNRMKTQHWKSEDTRLFYSALRQCGTDFSTMEQMYEGFDHPKSRRQLKSKYKRECKKNPKLIDMAMNPSAQIPLDLSLFRDLVFEKVTPTASTSATVSADNTLTGSNASEKGATPIKPVSSGSSPVESNSNDKVQQDVDKTHSSATVSTNSKQEPSEPINILGPEDGMHPIKKAEDTMEDTVDGAKGMTDVVSDVASSVLVEPVVKEKKEDTILEKPIALFGVRKKTTQRPKFRAKPRPKKTKVKRAVK